MICAGDKLLCTNGNPFFETGSTYTVGNIVTNELFEVKVGSNDEYWYATEDDEGISVRFNSNENAINDAWFSLAK
jgi:hypothetical protein